MRYRLWGLLDHQGRSLRWLAQRMEVSEDLVYAVKSGHRNATADFRAKAARALDIPEDILFSTSATEPTSAVAS